MTDTDFKIKNVKRDMKIQVAVLEEKLKGEVKDWNRPAASSVSFLSQKRNALNLRLIVSHYKLGLKFKFEPSKLATKKSDRSWSDVTL